jgi:hypothetical protein
MMSSRGASTEGSRTSVAALLGAGIFSGLSAYAFVIVGVRAFGAEAFAPIAVVWSLWAVAMAGVSTPLQHWIIQTVRVTRSEIPVRSRVPTLSGVVLAVSALVTIAAWFARSPLYGSDASTYPVVTGAVIATGALGGYVRGTLGARNQFAALSATLASDGALRFGLVVAAIAVGLGVDAAAMAIPAASLVVLCWPSAFRLSSDSTTVAEDTPRLGALVVAFLLLHFVLNIPPVLAAILDAAPEVVSSLFATFALFRAPFLVASVFATRVSFTLAGLAAHDDNDALDRFRRSVSAITVGAMALGLLFGTAPARFAIRLIYGPEVTLRAMEGPAIVAGSAASVGALMFVLLLAARGRARWSIPPLLIGVMGGVSWSLFAPGAPGERVAGGFLVGQSLLLIALMLAERRLGPGRNQDASRPISDTGQGSQL